MPVPVVRGDGRGARLVINDVILLGDRAWFTDSRDAVLYGFTTGYATEIALIGGVRRTAARRRDRLYLVNARFTSPQTPDTTFDAVAVTL
ncbi:MULTISPECIES: hypothetical protein [Streptomyces]|uniref:hypothetical protein n=1 Tax=Streptomyces TaxID=1883 RepID=UPI0022549613|nr:MULTISPECIES: hypothetical protein [Streptomyces]MCX4434997.1 hypothetical protein [Streptomyces mirabilis]